MKSLLEGTFLPRFEYKVIAGTLNKFYYLLDGMYPKWAIFISTIAEENLEKGKGKSLCISQIGIDKRRRESLCCFTITLTYNFQTM